MKIKNILVSLVAILALAAGCNQIEPDHFLSEVKVSSSYVAISMDGGSTTITVDATDSWSIPTCPDWLAISPASGSAGQTNVTFSASRTLDGRTAEVVINCGGKTQNINVIQGLAVVAPATCAEIIAGPDSKTYMVTGTVTAIANEQYGNWYLTDNTGTIYIYGTVNAAGSYPKDSGGWGKGVFDFSVGDEVTVQGPKTTYNGTVELVDVTVVKINKSLIKVKEMDPENGTIPSAGGDLTVTLDNKGTGVYIDIPETAQSWLSIVSVSGNTVKFHAAENTAGPRNVTLVFKTTDGKKQYSTEAAIMQLGASGSRELPFTVEEAIAYVQELAGETPTDFYVKGIISKIADKGEFGSYGNATFWISSDGQYHEDLTLDFEGYRVLWLDNQKWVEGNAQIAVGAEVILCGKLTTYKGTAETSGNKAYIYQINGVRSEVNGIGTEANPFNVAGAIEAANNIGGATAFNAYVTGKVSKIVNEFSAQYGNGTFWISDDGQFNDSKDKDFEAYRVLWTDGQKWQDGDYQIGVGDIVTLFGQLTLYKGTAETNSGKAWVYNYVPAD